ncbi:MAG: MotA/TolQ/ExbB proton channel family protein [Oceanococcus sp.]
MSRFKMLGRVAALSLLSLSALASAQNADETLDQLLDSVKRGQAEGRTVNAQRESRFVNFRNEQEKLYKQARAEASSLDRQAKGMRDRFTANEKELQQLKKSLADNSGDLEQLGTVFRQASGDAQSLLTDSLVTAQLPERLQVLTELARTEGIPAPEDVESLWYELQREMTENGRITSFQGEYIDGEGQPVKARIHRYGVFAATADDKYLRYQTQTRRLELLPRQPGGWLEQSSQDERSVLIDPTRGILFGLLVVRPSLQERIEQGGVVGAIILVLGFIGLLMTVFQLSYLFVQGGKIRRQRQDLQQPSQNNALGRILQAAKSAGSSQNMETLELAIDEAILKETPKLERLQNGIKLLAAVAPLLGLLGTVTGMIETFQAITLFGTGDPKLMAGGISQALMTTVLGLVVAIPLLFLHSLVASRSRVLIQTLDEQSAGMIARGQERQEALQQEAAHA